MPHPIPELYIACDIEADGPIPGPNSMLSRGYWMGLTGCEWVQTGKGVIKSRLGLQGLEHTHHAGEDAAELAAVFEAVLKHRSGLCPPSAAGDDEV